MDDKSDVALTCSAGTPWLNHFHPPSGTGKGCDGCRQTLAAAVAEARRLYDAGEYKTASALPEKNAMLSGVDLPNAVLVVSVAELQMIAERVVDVPALYDRVCSQMRAFDDFKDLDETPAHVLLENIVGVLVVSAITFANNDAADRFWTRSKADVRV